MCVCVCVCVVCVCVCVCVCAYMCVRASVYVCRVWVYVGVLRCPETMDYRFTHSVPGSYTFINIMLQEKVRKSSHISTAFKRMF